MTSYVHGLILRCTSGLLVVTVSDAFWKERVVEGVSRCNTRQDFIRLGFESAPRNHSTVLSESPPADILSLKQFILEYQSLEMNRR